MRQAHVQNTIYYGQVAEEIGHSTPRLGYELGCIGESLLKLSDEWGEDVPPIQCVVVNQSSKLPGEGIGWFVPDAKDFGRLSRTEQRKHVNRMLSRVYGYPRWQEVLRRFGLRSAPGITDTHSLGAARTIRRGHGESAEHARLKHFIAYNPSVVDLPSRVAPGDREYTFPSGDTVDVLFRDRGRWIAVEVKSRRSDEPDILRGMFQCVKYQALGEADQRAQRLRPNCEAVLAIEAPFPKALVPTKHALQVNVVEEIQCDEDD